MMFHIQDFIHRLEEGGGKRVVQVTLASVIALLLIGGYNWRAFRNFSTQEAMDNAQLARNIADGRGFTTHFVRPFSMHLLQRHAAATQSPDQPPVPDPSQLKGMHPDLANPPLYPLLLAGWMKILPFDYPVDINNPFWSAQKSRVPDQTDPNFQFRMFWRYQPDFLIGILNQILFFGVIALGFIVAKKLFDERVAWMTGLLLLGTELLWRFSISGLPTMLLMLIFMGLIWSITTLEEEGREPKRGMLFGLGLAALIGFLTGLGAMTRYSFAWLILPVLGFVLLVSGPNRLKHGLITLLVFGAVVTPWIVRNYSLSGTPFGIATYALVEGTPVYTGHELQRTLKPEVSLPGIVVAKLAWYKLIANSRLLFQNDLPKMAGNWVSAFFLVGLLISFNSPAIKRLRFFSVISLIILAMAQALTRTQLSEDSPEINSENLLVLLAPVAIMYGVSLFFLILEQINLPFPQLRLPVIALFAAIVCFPLAFSFLPPRIIPVVYPPYYPPAIQHAVGYVKEDELTMSDIPWAVAWYGQSQCVWLTLRVEPDFYSINDYHKAIQEVFITHVALDSRQISLVQWIRGGSQGWGEFILGCLMLKKQGLTAPPKGFPLRYWQGGWPDQFLLTFREHYPKAQ